MKHLLVTFIIFMIILFALVLGADHLPSEYSKYFNRDFIFGYLSSGIIAFTGFCCFNLATEQIKSQCKRLQSCEKQNTNLKTELVNAQQEILQLKKIANSIYSSATQAADYIFKQSDQRNIFEITQLNERIKKAVTEYKSLRAETKEKDNLINKLTADLKSKEAGLASYRQKIAAIRSIALTYKFQNGSSVWDNIAQQLKQLKKEQHQRDKKIFTPSAPTKGKRAQNYQSSL